jgi:hypothetical protein
MSKYTAVKLDEIEELNDGRVPWRPVAARLGITSFGANSWTAHGAGDRIINEHDEAEEKEEELYVVMRGHATFELDGERVDAPSGSFVFVPPGIKRTAIAQEADTTIIAVGAVPGKPYEPHVWSIWGPLHPDYEAGRFDEVADRGLELLKDYPQNAGLYYNVACCESLAGRRADALAHLARSVELSETYRALAREDSDFDPIRDEPAFRELVGS